jgi:hypothetical protein
MSVQMTKARVFVHNVDVSGQLSGTNLSFGAEPLDATVLNSTTRTRVGGLRTVGLSHSGYLEYGASSSAVDPLFYDRIGTTGVAVTVCGNGSTEGASPAYVIPALHTQFSFGGEVGTLLAFDVTAEGDSIARGAILRHTTAETVDGNGTAFQLTGSSGRTLWGALHVMALSGSTAAGLTVKIQSANTSGFGAPNDRITFSNTTASTSQLGSAVGTTDDWYRVNIVMTGTSDGATAHHLVSVGITQTT